MVSITIYPEDKVVCYDGDPSRRNTVIRMHDANDTGVMDLYSCHPIYVVRGGRKKQNQPLLPKIGNTLTSPTPNIWYTTNGYGIPFRDDSQL